MLGSVADAFEGNTQRAFFIPLIGFCIAWTFPLYLNLFKAKSLDGWTENFKVSKEPTPKIVVEKLDNIEKSVSQKI